MLVIHHYMALAVFAIYLDNRDHLWGPLLFFDRAVFSPYRNNGLGLSYRDAVVYPTNTNSKANFF